MNKKTVKYWLAAVFLTISSLMLLFLVVRNFYSISAFRVNLIYPEEKILVSTEFTASLMITGSKDPDIILIKIDNITIQSEKFSSTGYTRVGDFKLLNIRINPESLPEGNHTLEIILKGGLLTKESNVSAEFIYERIIPPTREKTDEETAKMDEYFAEDVTNLIIKLNNSRYYYTNSDWRQSEGYITAKEKVTSGGIDSTIKDRITELINRIENGSPLTEINNAANSLNIQLYNNGYPFMTLMFEYRYMNGETRSILLIYRIVDLIQIDYRGRKETAYELKRVDRIQQKEQFLGVNFPNSPFPVVLYDNTKELAEKYGKLFSGSEGESLQQASKLTGRTVKERKQLEKIARLIRQELNEGGYRSEDLYMLVRKANAVHELRHLLDFKTSTRIGKSVPSALDYFYGEIRGGSNFARDTSYTIEKNVAATLMKINPEFSAYLFELAFSDGLRRIQILDLYEKIVNRRKEDTSHHWASKFIIYLLAEKNGFTKNNLITEKVEGNEEEWLEITLKLIELPAEKIKEDSLNLYSYEFDE